MSNSIASEISPAIRRAGRLTTNSAWQPSISAFGSARSPRRPANTVRRRSPEVDRQPDELAGSGNEFHSFDQSSTDVDLLEMGHRNFGFDWSGNETGHGLCSIESIATAS